MLGQYVTRHHSSGECQNCHVDVDESRTIRWSATVGKDGGTASGELPLGEAGVKNMVAATVGVPPGSIVLHDVFRDDGSFIAIVKIGTVPLDPIKIDTHGNSNYTPEECTYEADICLHSHLIGQYCYYCPDHKASDVPLES